MMADRHLRCAQGVAEGDVEALGLVLRGLAPRIHSALRQLAVDYRSPCNRSAESRADGNQQPRYRSAWQWYGSDRQLRCARAGEIGESRVGIGAGHQRAAHPIGRCWMVADRALIQSEQHRARRQHPAWSADDVASGALHSRLIDC